MKIALKWLVSIAIGALFVWLSSRSWPLEEVFDYEFRIEGSYLIAGDVDPKDVEWWPSPAGSVSEAAPAPSGTPYRHALSSPFAPAAAATAFESEACPAPAVPVAPTGGHALEAPRAKKARAPGWSFNLLYILPYAAFLVLIHFLRVIRWDPLLRPIAKIDFWKLNRVGAVGFMAVFIFPLRLGELVRPYLIAERGKVRMSEALATIVVERVMDGLTTSLLLFFVLRFLPTDRAESYAEFRAGSYLALAIFLGAMAVLSLTYWRRAWTIAAIRAVVGRVLPGVAEKVIAILEAFIRGLSVLPDWRNFAAFTGLTMVYWAVNGLGLWVFVQGFGLHVPLVACYAMMASIVVGMMLPNSPANVGSFWVFLLWPLTLYGIGTTNVQATAAALGIWAMQTLQLLVFAGWFIARGQVSAKDVWTMTTGRRPASAASDAEDGMEETAPALATSCTPPESASSAPR